VVLSILHFHHHFYGRKFKVRSDHGALRWLLDYKITEGQIARWLQLVGTYDFEIEHRAGRIHNNADALSRRPCDKHDNNPRDIRSESGGTISNKGSLCTSRIQGSQGFESWGG
jgi:hypothetical protein